MADPVTVALAAKHLRLDPPLEAGGDYSDQDLIELMIVSAKLYCEEYLNFDLPDETIPAPIISAQLLIIGDLYRNRESKISTRVKSNPAVENLLFPYRVELGI